MSVPAAIEWNKVGELVWAAPVAGLVVIVTYALVILGVARADEARRTGETAAATAFTALAVVAAAAFLAAVAFGVVVIVVK